MTFVTTDSDIIFAVIMLLVFAELVSKTMNTFSCTACNLLPIVDISLTCLQMIGIDLTRLFSNELVNLILYGRQDLTVVANRIIIEVTLKYMREHWTFQEELTFGSFLFRPHDDLQLSKIFPT